MFLLVFEICDPVCEVQVFFFDVQQQLILLDVFAAGRFETLEFLILTFISAGNIDDSWYSGVTGLVENHLQLDSLRVLGGFVTFGNCCNRNTLIGFNGLDILV